MKKFGLYILVFIIPLLCSCFECREPSVQSEIHFDSLETLGVTRVSLSKFGDSISDGSMTIHSLESGGFIYPRRFSGPEILHAYHYFHYEWPFLLWLNENDEIIAVWDLNDTTQRWANEANWYMDSSVCEVCGGAKDQMKYTNHYVFSVVDEI